MQTQLIKLKKLLGNPTVEDDVLNFHLDRASDIICNLRNSNEVETKYLNIQLQIAVEMFNKIGAEGQTSHVENGINRTYDGGDVSQSLLAQITPCVTTPFSYTRIVNMS